MKSLVMAAGGAASAFEVQGSRCKVLGALLLAEGDGEAQQRADIQEAGRALVGMLRDDGVELSSAGLSVETPRLEAHHLPAKREDVDLLVEEGSPSPEASSPSPQPSPQGEGGATDGVEAVPTAVR